MTTNLLKSFQKDLAYTVFSEPTKKLLKEMIEASEKTDEQSSNIEIYKKHIMFFLKELDKKIDFFKDHPSCFDEICFAAIECAKEFEGRQNKGELNFIEKIFRHLIDHQKYESADILYKTDLIDLNRIETNAGGTHLTHYLLQEKLSEMIFLLEVLSADDTNSLSQSAENQKETTLSMFLETLREENVDANDPTDVILLAQNFCQSDEVKRYLKNRNAFRKENPNRAKGKKDLGGLDIYLQMLLPLMARKDFETATFFYTQEKEVFDKINMEQKGLCFVYFLTTKTADAKSIKYLGNLLGIDFFSEQDLRIGCIEAFPKEWLAFICGEKYTKDFFESFENEKALEKLGYVPEKLEKDDFPNVPEGPIENVLKLSLEAQNDFLRWVRQVKKEGYTRAA